MKEIQLTQGQVALVDDEDYERVNQFKWHARWNKHTKSFYAVRNVGKFPNQKVVYLARSIMNTPENMLCDHKNNNSLDNQKHNLRNVTISQNNMNARLRKDNKTGFKGICLVHGKYLVQVWCNNKRIIQERFDNLEEAIAARDEAMNKYHGEFANKD